MAVGVAFREVAYGGQRGQIQYLEIHLGRRGVSTNQFERTLSLRRVAAGEGELGSFGGESQSCLEADATVGAGDDNRLAIQARDVFTVPVGRHSWIDWPFLARAQAPAWLFVRPMGSGWGIPLAVHGPA